jgi:hypothetical protein
MSLFVGNISKNVKEGELEKEFEKFGTCKIRNKVPIPSTNHPSSSLSPEPILSPPSPTPRPQLLSFPRFSKALILVAQYPSLLELLSLCLCLKALL